MNSQQLLQAATSQNFAVPTPPYADGTWEMYQDFVGGLQFWGYALASGSGDGGVRMWDRKLCYHLYFRGRVWGVIVLGCGIVAVTV